MTRNVMSAADPTMPEMEAIPVKVVWLINFPEGGKDAYDNWVASVAETIVAPAELVRSRTYDNVDSEMHPHRYVELEFESYLDAATYMNRPEIAAVLQDATNHITDQTVYTFIQRSYDSKDVAGDWQVKRVVLIDYPLGEKQAYLEWVASIAQTVIEPPQLKAIASYDNYYGTSPHRLVTLEFANQEDLKGYLEEIQAISDEDDRRSGGRVRHTFQLLSVYVKEQ